MFQVSVIIFVFFPVHEFLLNCHNIRALISFVSLDQSLDSLGAIITITESQFIHVCIYTHTEVTVITITEDRSHAKRKLEVKSC